RGVADMSVASPREIKQTHFTRHFHKRTRSNATDLGTWQYMETDAFKQTRTHARTHTHTHTHTPTPTHDTHTHTHTHTHTRAHTHTHTHARTHTHTHTGQVFWSFDAEINL